MARISYVDGSYLTHSHASVSVEDRSYNFSDGVYEVMAFYHRRFLDEALHLKRLARSLKELGIPAPMSEGALKLVMRELVARNAREHGTIYIQITRGVSRRDHHWEAAIQSSIFMMICPIKMPYEKDVLSGVKCISAPDIRWGRRDVKSTSLLPNVMAKQSAVSQQAKEAWLVKPNGEVTEGSSTNAYIVVNGELITHPEGPDILGGVTRTVALELARKAQIKVIERPFKIEEVYKADEAFITSTSINVLPVSMLDGKKIGSGKQGEISRRLLELYKDHIKEQTGYHA